MVNLVEIPCPPVHHSAETLRSWAIWRKARPWWKAKPVAAKCFAVAGAVGTVGGLGAAAATLIPPLLAPAPAAIVEPAPGIVVYPPLNSYGQPAPDYGQAAGGGPFNPGPVIGFVPLVPIGGGFYGSNPGGGGGFGGLPGFPGGGPGGGRVPLVVASPAELLIPTPLVPADLVPPIGLVPAPGPGDTSLFPTPPVGMVPPVDQVPPTDVTPPIEVTPPVDLVPPAQDVPEPSSLFLLGVALILAGVIRDGSVVAYLRGWLGRRFGRGRLGRRA